MFKRIARAAGCFMLAAIITLSAGCHAIDREIFGDGAINDFIYSKGEDLDEIKELVLDPGDDQCLSSSHYDKLGKLKNLESITFVGIGYEKDAQNFFEELTKLDNLKTVIIKDSRIGSIEKLTEIKGIEELRIILGSYSMDSWKIDDLDELVDLENLRVLELQNVFKDELPDLRGLEHLEKLTISSYDITELPYELADWSNLKYLSISATNISKIDDRIIGELTNLKELDVSYSKIGDVSFVPELPELEKFTYNMHSHNEVDMEILKDHVNFDESWLND